ncbi:MAG TPA: HD domain-containing protein [Candidatus Saccharimonadales bacterium]
MSLPTDEQIIALHHKYAASDSAFELIYTHCRVVEAIAMQLLDTKPIESIDKQLVHVGCLLHDIGTYFVLDMDNTFMLGIRHGVIGELILKSEDMPETVWRFASHHTGIGLTKKDVIKQRLPIPAADYTAQTDEEQLIMYADKFHTKANPPHFYSFERYRDFVGQFGRDKALGFDALATKFGKPNLSKLSSQFEFEIR